MVPFGLGWRLLVPTVIDTPITAATRNATATVATPEQDPFLGGAAPLILQGWQARRCPVATVYST